MGFFSSKKNQTTAELAQEFGQAQTQAPTIGAAKTVTLRKETGAAISLEKIQAINNVDLTKRYQKAGFALSKFGMDGARANVVMLLDFSGSMYGDYQNGTVQKIVERALAFAANIDDDGQMPIIPFDNTIHPVINADLSNFAGIINRELFDGRSMGGTQMAAPLNMVKQFAEESEDPIYLIVVGDGSPWDAEQTKRAVIELANYPVFIKFLSVRPVDFLDELDDLDDTQRLLDNVDSKSIQNPDSLTDMELAEIMADEWLSWTVAATAKGVLK